MIALFSSKKCTVALPYLDRN